MSLIIRSPYPTPTTPPPATGTPIGLLLLLTR
jgi:hypothetical protein